MRKEIKREIGVEGTIENTVYKDGTKAILYKGRPLSDAPKTYKKVGVVSHSIGNNYNPGILSIFKAKDGTYRYEIYRDGSIYPYYGKFVIVKN